MNASQSHLDCLAQSLGVDQLTLGEDGLRTLAVGSDLQVHLQADLASEEFVIFCLVGQLSGLTAESTLKRMLRANRFWRGTGGATLSLDEHEPARVILARRVSWQAATPVQFAAAFESFIDHAADWVAHFAAGLEPGSLSGAALRAQPIDYA